MNYVSTRDKQIKVTAAKAIAQGISVEGGLFVPDTFPTLNSDDFKHLSQMDYKGRAKYILKSFKIDSFLFNSSIPPFFIFNTSYTNASISSLYFFVAFSYSVPPFCFLLLR